MCVGGGRSGNHVSPNPPIYNTSNHVTSHPRTGLAREDKGGGGGPGVESGLGAVPEEEVVACVCVFDRVFVVGKGGLLGWWGGCIGWIGGSSLYTHAFTHIPPTKPTPNPLP